MSFGFSRFNGIYGLSAWQYFGKIIKKISRAKMKDKCDV